MDISKKELNDLLVDVQYERVEARMTPYDLAEEQLGEWRCHFLTSRKSMENVEGFGKYRVHLQGQ